MTTEDVLLSFTQTVISIIILTSPETFTSLLTPDRGSGEGGEATLQYIPPTKLVLFSASLQGIPTNSKYL